LALRREPHGRHSKEDGSSPPDARASSRFFGAIARPHVQRKGGGVDKTRERYRLHFVKKLKIGRPARPLRQLGRPRREN